MMKIRMCWVLTRTSSLSAGLVHISWYSAFAFKFLSSRLSYNKMVSDEVKILYFNNSQNIFSNAKI